MRLTGPLRIGICAPYDLGRHGGVNSHIRAQAAALRRLGHDVTVFGASSAPLTDGEISLGPCVSLVIGNTETGFGADPRSWRRVRTLFRQRQFDVIHMHEPLMPLVSWFVLNRLWRTETVEMVKVNIAAFALLAVGFLLTFPPFMDLLQGK